MKIIFNEFNIDNIINKYIKCFKDTNSKFGFNDYTIDEPFSESEIVHMMVIDIELSEYEMLYTFLLNDYATLEVYLGEEIELFDINPETK